jgi:hypothetical protein
MTRLTFAKHQTFYIRDGWLYKGMRAIQMDASIFTQESAPQTLGLGKNMVQSLRYWIVATQLATETLTKQGNVQHLTRFGELVFEYDPYQELDGTLWLIHYHLVTNRDKATAWYWFFNHFAPNIFTRQEFIARLAQWVNTQGEDVKSEQSFTRDCDCLALTYLSRSQDRSPEDSLISPLANLGLLSEVEHQDDEDKRVRSLKFNLIRSNSIHPLVFLYILLKQQELERPSARQLSLIDALREPKNAGRVLNIGMQTLEEILLKLEESYPDFVIRLTRTGGLDQLTLPNISADEVLQIFYQQSDTTEDVKQWAFQTN